MPWTVFQGVPPSLFADGGGDGDREESARREKAAIRQRAGPLLALFPDPVAAAEATGDGPASNGRYRHAVFTPAEQRSYLATHGGLCHPPSGSDGNGVLDRYDLFAKSPTLPNLATEMWKYCALYAEGGIYADAETAPLVALSDALRWDRSGSLRKNYSVAASTQDAGVSPSLLPGGGSGSSISDAVTTAISLGTGNPVAISSVVAIASKEHPVPFEMVGTLMESPVEILEEDALLPPRRLMKLIREVEGKAGHGKWGLLKQRCNGIEVAGDKAAQEEAV